MERQTKTFVVFEGDEYGPGGWPPNNAAEFMAWFGDKLAGVPAESMPSTTIGFNTCKSYDSTYITLTIEYSRPETNEELAARHKNNAIVGERRRNEELRTLAALLTKYPQPEIPR